MGPVRALEHRSHGLLVAFPGRKIREVQLGQKVAIYCRVSTADQSCARQEQDLLAYADRAGFEVVEIRREISSGTKDQRSERK
ncbi:recombinase family protein, partial [Desulfovibrio sp. TomC]|uniref:recombinase family protein n=1 Tax=Desulfovibrio sp. TomC TaxID=1562888 RepID=UPI001E491261